MIVNRGNSLNKLQREIHRDLSTSKMRRECSLTTFSRGHGSRENFLKSVKSVFIEDEVKMKKKKAVVDKRSLEKSVIKSVKLSKAEEAVKLKSQKPTGDKLKKKRCQVLSKQFTAMSRKQSQAATQASRTIPTCTSVISQADYVKLLQENRKYEQKIQSQKVLIKRLQSIIQQLVN